MSAPSASDDAQPVDGQQRDQRVLPGRGESGSDEQGADLVAVQAGGVGLVVETRTTNMRGRRSDRAALPARRSGRSPPPCTAAGRQSPEHAHVLRGRGRSTRCLRGARRTAEGRAARTSRRTGVGPTRRRRGSGPDSRPGTPPSAYRSASENCGSTTAISVVAVVLVVVMSHLQVKPGPGGTGADQAQHQVEDRNLRTFCRGDLARVGADLIRRTVE